MRTGIVILNYGNFKDTINCIKSVYKYCTNQNLQIVVVDNGSENDSVAQISSFLNKTNWSFDLINKRSKSNSQIVIISTHINLGYAKGNNIGIRFFLKQKVDYILILNNDILLTSNIIPLLTDCLEKNPDIGIISPLLMRNKEDIDYNCCRKNPSDNMFIFESLAFLKIPIFKRIIDKKYLLKTNSDLKIKKFIYCDIVSGACILAKTVTWEKLNGFDENTFLYYEENILFEKLKQLNFKMALLPSVDVIHLGAKSTKKVLSIEILKIELNSLLYYLKNYRKINTYKLKFIKYCRLLQIHILSLLKWI
jgi:GT2 family glycosyltransferase